MLVIRMLFFCSHFYAFQKYEHFLNFSTFCHIPTKNFNQFDQGFMS